MAVMVCRPAWISPRSGSRGSESGNRCSRPNRLGRWMRGTSRSCRSRRHGPVLDPMYSLLPSFVLVLGLVIVLFGFGRGRSSRVVAEGLGDAALGDFVLAVDALGVDAQQDLDAVAGPLGDLGRRDAGVEPAGQAGVPQVVDALGERRRRLPRGADPVTAVTTTSSTRWSWVPRLR